MTISEPLQSGIVLAHERDLVATPGEGRSPAMILAAIEAAGLSISRISHGQGRLEDAYIRLIGSAPAREEAAP